MSQRMCWGRNLLFCALIAVTCLVEKAYPQGLKASVSNRGSSFGALATRERYLSNLPPSNIPYNPTYTGECAMELDCLTIHAYMKHVQPLQGSNGFYKNGNIANGFNDYILAIDQAIAFAQQNNMKVHLHTLVFDDLGGANSNNPSWVFTITDKTQMQNALRSYIQFVVGRWSKKVDAWDVVNEPIINNSDSQGAITIRPGHFRNVIKGATGADEDYVGFVFGETVNVLNANNTAPGDKNPFLIINEHSTENLNFSGKYNRLRNLIMSVRNSNSALTSRKLGVGWQMHALGLQDILGSQYLSGVMSSNYPLESRFAQIESDNFYNFITEFDFDMQSSIAADFERQKIAYKRISEIFLRGTTYSKRGYFQTWGVSDDDSWRNQPLFPQPPSVENHFPLLLRGATFGFSKKPAYYGVKEAFDNELGVRRLYNIGQSTFCLNVYEQPTLPERHVNLEQLDNHPQQATRMGWASLQWDFQKQAPDSTGIPLYRLTTRWGVAGGAPQDLNCDLFGTTYLAKVRPRNGGTTADWDSQKWYAELAGPGQYWLKNKYYGRYLTAVPNGTSYQLNCIPKNASNAFQKWRIEFVLP